MAEVLGVDEDTLATAVAANTEAAFGHLVDRRLATVVGL